MKIIFAAFMMAQPAAAYTLRYKVKSPDPVAVLARVEALTGLNFEGKCAEWKPEAPPKVGFFCGEWKPIHGSIITGPDFVQVEVFQAKQPDRRAVPVKIDADLKRKIGKAVTSAAPPPSR